MQITPNEVSTSNVTPSNLDLKVAQLINNLAGKPLLIEKLVLAQSQGLLLSLSIDKPPLQLQLPLKLAQSFENVGQNINKLSLSVTNQQRIELTLLPSNLEASTKLGVNSQQAIKPIVFQKALLLPDGLLKLDNPKLAAVQVANSTNRLQNTSNLDAGRLNSTPPLNQANTSALPAKVTDKPSNSKINEITVAEAAKTILKTHFTKQLPIASHIENIVKFAQALPTTDSPHPLVAKLNQQLVHLVSQIEKPTDYSATEIKQRVNDSGHFLEKNLAHQLRVGTELGSESKSTLKQTELTNSQVKETPVLVPQKLSLEQSNDTKLILLKIKTTLETLIRRIETPVTSEKASPQPTSSPLQPNEIRLSESQRILLEQLTRNLLSQQNNKPEQQVYRTAIQTKNQILNLQQAAIKQTSEILAEVKSTLSQIESNQLLSLKNETPNLHQFLIDLPIKNNSEIDSFEMLFENSDITQGKQKVKKWKVIVRFDLEPLGPMFAQIELENERISTHFFAKAQQTAALINQHLHILKQSLFSAGVDIEKLQGSQGKIPDTLIRNSEQLVDTHA